MKSIVILVLLAPALAWAGKTEREYMAKTVTPAITTAQAEYKKGCGCDLKLTVDEGTMKTEDDLYQAKHIAENIAESAPKYCTDAASKKAVCKMKSLKMNKATKTAFTFSGSAGVATTDGQSFPNFDMMTQELDK